MFSERENKMSYRTDARFFDYDSDLLARDARDWGDSRYPYIDRWPRQTSRRGESFGGCGGSCPDSVGCSRRHNCPYGLYPPKPGNCDYYGDLD
jgi:hypothetical protein